MAIVPAIIPAASSCIFIASPLWGRLLPVENRSIPGSLESVTASELRSTTAGSVRPTTGARHCISDADPPGLQSGSRSVNLILIGRMRNSSRPTVSTICRPQDGDRLAASPKVCRGDDRKLPVARGNSSPTPAQPNVS